MSLKLNKATRNERNRQAAAGVQKHLTSAVVLGGTSYAPTKLSKILLDPASKADATAAAEGAYHEAVVEEQAATKLADTLFLLLKKAVINLYADQPAVMADFGIEAPAPKTPSAATKAEAVVKRAATRKANKPSAPPAPAAPKA